jgi:hypothetical protein
VIRGVDDAVAMIALGLVIFALEYGLVWLLDEAGALPAEDEDDHVDVGF